MDYKFKVGDEVKTEYGDGVVVFVDKGYFMPYLVKIDGYEGHNGGVYGYVNKDGICDKRWCFGSDLNLIEPKKDLRDLLQVGYKVDTLPAPLSKDDIDSIIAIGYPVDEIYRPKYNGLKPMEWELVWEREEPLFTLSIPNNAYGRKYLRVDLNKPTKYGFYRKQNNGLYQDGLKTKFTQKEIYSLPNQKFIKSLEQKPVEGE